MVYQFRFVHTAEDGSTQKAFQCNLKCDRCTETNKKGLRCKVKTCIGTPYCWQHLLSKHHLRILPSTLKEAGKGLFAMGKAGDRAVFRKNDVIIVYDGEVTTQQGVDQRYGEGDDITAPYAIDDVNGGVMEDAACRRGTGAIANHSDKARTINASIEIRDGRLALIATKNIGHNAEIWINYGHAYRFDEAGVAHKTVRAR